ncbi:hypothetical protein GBA52_004202 [Prunus armeniaca]|nr:hypothetical protein GBA52_004202 [Prunus armeniaca]
MAIGLFWPSPSQRNNFISYPNEYIQTSTQKPKQLKNGSEEINLLLFPSVIVSSSCHGFGSVSLGSRVGDNGCAAGIPCSCLQVWRLLWMDHSGCY